MSEQVAYETNEENLWRAETPGPEGWKRTAHRDDPEKYLMISADTHANEPHDLWAKRIDKKYVDRLPVSLPTRTASSGASPKVTARRA